MIKEKHWWKSTVWSKVGAYAIYWPDIAFSWLHDYLLYWWQITLKSIMKVTSGNKQVPWLKKFQTRRVNSNKKTALSEKATFFTVPIYWPAWKAWMNSWVNLRLAAWAGDWTWSLRFVAGLLIITWRHDWLKHSMTSSEGRDNVRCTTCLPAERKRCLAAKKNYSREVKR